MLELGRLYESEGDKMEAFRHYLVAATFGLPRACEKIAVMYENGDVIHDVNEALRWQSKAVASSTLRT
ncbi:hypothetical protein BC833DRAFT_609893 [Globomyces pollinis-pini]|nr:hypothetical protein BC833DRAFT_609893 [Globomyces pollinis-pini]